MSYDLERIINLQIWLGQLRPEEFHHVYTVQQEAFDRLSEFLEELREEETPPEVGTLVRVDPDGMEVHHQRNLGYPDGTVYRVSHVYKRRGREGWRVQLAAVDERWRIPGEDWSMAHVDMADLQVIEDNNEGGQQS